MNTLASLVKTNSLKIHILQQYLLYKINLLSSFKTNLHPTHTQNTCWFQFFLLMKMLIFLKPPIKKLHCHCTKGLDFIGLWLYLVVWYFYRQKLQCHCTKCPVFLVMKMHSYFNPPPSQKKAQCHCTKWPYFLGYNSLQCQQNKIAHRPVKKPPPPRK